METDEERGMKVSKRLTQSSTVKVKRLRKKTTRKKARENHSALLKYGSLVLLVTQLVGLVLLMRYSRTNTSGPDLYLSSTAVFSMEVMKFIVCNAVVFSQSGSTIKGWAIEMHTHIWNSPNQMVKMSIPSVLYVVQNNLLYLALTNLDVATYQVCYQLKILTTALFSVLMLGVRFLKGIVSFQCQKVLQQKQ